MGKRNRSSDRVYADKEDELHDPKGKTTRLAVDRRTPRDTDNPLQESVVGAGQRVHLHPKKSKLPKAPPVAACRPVQPAQLLALPSAGEPVSGAVAPGLIGRTSSKSKKGSNEVTKNKMPILAIDTIHGYQTEASIPWSRHRTAIPEIFFRKTRNIETNYQGKKTGLEARSSSNAGTLQPQSGSYVTINNANTIWVQGQLFVDWRSTWA
ncbi:hypothetical protein MMC31_004217 [Peltigera leucophlebia]|nr:hypothetical protein [Peltigera leucophlebia]